MSFFPMDSSVHNSLTPILFQPHSLLQYIASANCYHHAMWYHLCSNTHNSKLVLFFSSSLFTPLRHHLSMQICNGSCLCSSSCLHHYIILFLSPGNKQCIMTSLLSTFSAKWLNNNENLIKICRV